MRGNSNKKTYRSPSSILYNMYIRSRVKSPIKSALLSNLVDSEGVGKGGGESS